MILTIAQVVAKSQKYCYYFGGTLLGKLWRLWRLACIQGRQFFLLYYVDLRWRSSGQVVFRVPDSICLVSFSVWFCSYWVGGLSRIFLQKSHLEWRPPHETHFFSYPLISFFCYIICFCCFRLSADSPPCNCCQISQL